jgi:hypothetical protein
MNRTAISVQGCVTDSIEKTPIVGANVTILCWYHAEWNKTDYTYIDTTTDRNGCFSAKFEKGYKVIVASVAPKYSPTIRATEGLDNSNIGINLELKKRQYTIDTAEPKINLRRYIVQKSSS